jgi:hypothetical protein
VPRYCVPIQVEDNTGTTTVTMFDNAMEPIIGMTCAELIQKTENENPTIPPAELEQLIGQTRVLHLELQKDRKQGRQLLAAATPEPQTTLTLKHRFVRHSQGLTSAHQHQKKPPLRRDRSYSHQV